MIILKDFIKKKQLNGITEYDAFFPDTFYKTWELLKNKNLLKDKIKVGCVNNVTSLGTLEAIIKYCETYTYYEENEYVQLYVIDDIRNKLFNRKFYDIYKFDTHTFKNNSTLQDTIQKRYVAEKFDIVIHDYLENEYVTLETSIDINKKKGNLIVNVHNIFDPNLNATIDLLNNYYENVSFYKSECGHPLEPSIFIIAMNKIKKATDSESEMSPIDKPEKDVNNISKYLMNYEDKYLNFLSLLVSGKPKEYDYIDEAIKWANQNDMEIRSIYKHKQNDYELLKENMEIYEFQSNELQNTETIQLNAKYKILNPVLHGYKRELNKFKRIIDTKEQMVNNDVSKDIIDWNKLTNCIDVYRHIKRILKWKCNIELASNAWTKLYELLITFDLFDTHMSTHLKTLHLYEDSCSSIHALKQYVKRYSYSIENIDWYINLHEEVDKKKIYPPDDFRLIKQNADRCLYTSEKIGDMTAPDVITDLQKDSRLKNIDFIMGTCTNHSGLKVPPNMLNEQEAYVAKLIYAQCLTTLHILQRGKCCIFKAFIPFAESITISLIYLLTTLFGKVYITKPLTSHASSSEIFIVCKNYIGWDNIPPILQKRLFWILKNFHHTISIYQSVPDLFIKQLEECSSKFVTLQKNAIQRSLYYRSHYYSDYDMQNKVSELRYKMAELWIKKYIK
ncbi:MAG: FtsJ-like methyltransferase [Edafosvirus sp.]|uniref:FtsJ-like methyltransferase n=1 Tax=Edafosvirus sp. TaxID=2487765 RepID=A0A3G4ZXT1_9VIRU|nr:MAG: FtsJ-like methyltransferase [Edafosvirus sp.]